MSSKANVDALDSAVDKMAEADEREQRKNKILTQLLEGTDHHEGVFGDLGDDGIDTPVISIEKKTVNGKFANMQPADQEEDKLILTALESTENNEFVTPAARVESIPNQHYSARVEVVEQVETPPTPSKPSAFASMFNSIKSFTQSLTSSAKSTPVKSRPQNNRLRRVRNEAVTSLLFETFAHLDRDKDGMITKDEAWQHYSLVCNKARLRIKSSDGVHGIEWDDEVWQSSEADFEDALTNFPRYCISHDIWCEFFAEIDLEDDMLEQLMLEALKPTHS